ncbi:MAG: hypothetical protein HY076_00060 [Candidatus Eisenbacteria bacterium]|uniref:Fibronectin type-III domain-containing protein n=1 Tax=Eiseniibacteriota bacterium TaxID=2212470 RepID=A0A9D6QIY6_UNCEI|nr:hypothetical protein [Candidatus Eisenbacteria bacterium]MBI3538655.1 hypothetical protein [Candidatus Eisenbacteria bacterium]
MHTRWMLITAVVLAAAGAAGCDDQTTAPRDLTPPAAPRGFLSVTGDHSVRLSWLANTESDVAGYRIYEGPCASGPGCPFTRIGTTSATTFTVTSLANGVTEHFAVAAYDYSGNESDLSFEDVYDTPRPAGTGAALTDYQSSPALAGWNFAAAAPRAWNNAQTDMYFGWNGSVAEMAVPDYQTDIQDAGYATTLDAVDFAPSAGWSPTGTVELILGHCYVVWTRDNHFAKFRVTGLTLPITGPASVTFDWAYQVDPGNRELHARPARPGSASLRPISWIR